MTENMDQDDPERIVTKCSTPLFELKHPRNISLICPWTETSSQYQWYLPMNWNILPISVPFAHELKCNTAIFRDPDPLKKKNGHCDHIRLRHADAPHLKQTEVGRSEGNRDLHILLKYPCHVLQWHVMEISEKRKWLSDSFMTWVVGLLKSNVKINMIQTFLQKSTMKLLPNNVQTMSLRGQANIGWRDE